MGACGINLKVDKEAFDAKQNSYRSVNNASNNNKYVEEYKEYMPIENPACDGLADFPDKLKIK